MLVLLALVASIALVDSLNPSTVGPALLLALGEHAVRDMTAFLIGVLGTSTVAGLVLVLGPGRALLAIAAKPRPHVVHLIEVAVGVVVLLVAGALWIRRERLAGGLAESLGDRFSPMALGAVIIVAELPTAFPYFAALAAIVESRQPIAAQVLLVVVFNLCFCAPILILLGAVIVGGERAQAVTTSARHYLERYAAVLIPILLGLLGAAILAVGLVGLRGD